MSQAVGSQINNLVSGSPGDKPMLLYIGGAILVLVGLGQVAWKGKQTLDPDTGTIAPNDLSAAAWGVFKNDDLGARRADPDEVSRMNLFVPGRALVMNKHGFPRGPASGLIPA